MSEATENKQERRESVKLDEIMRLLFDMSKETLVNMLNGLFNETFDPELVDITKDNGKFVNEQLEVIEGDLFLRVFVPGSTKPYLFHIEFQTAEDGTMAIRVLRYGLNKAVENQNLSGCERILYMPKSLVIHIEAHENIPDEYKEIIIFADGDRKEFIVPVLKYWKLSEDYLIKHNLFPLLPLQIFLLRAELDKLTKNNDDKAKQAAILKAKKIAEKIAKIALELNHAEQLVDGDYKKVLIAIENLFIHLNNRYKGDEKLNEGVGTMLKELDPSIIGAQEAKARAAAKTAEETSISIAQNLLDVLDVETIADKTKLALEKVKELKEQYLKNKASGQN